MGNLLAWVLVVGGAIAAATAGITAALWVQYFILRRWRARVRLPDPVAYADVPSFRCDQEIIMRIHSTKPVRIVFHRCGATEFAAVHTMEAQASLQSRVMDRWRGFNWKPSATLAPNTLAPGLYRADIEHREDPASKWSMLLIVRHTTVQPVVVVASTNTWNAYNDFGGLSNYADRATPQPLKALRALLMYFDVKVRIGDKHWLTAVPLPERRPNGALHADLKADPREPSHLGRAEAALIRFLEREGVDHTIISDRDFAYELCPSRVRLVIFNTHSEYWSEEMLGRLNEFINRGISVVFLSGNNMYRKVQFLETGSSVISWMTPPEEVVPLIGSYYDAYGYKTYDAYRVADASHWCFEGISVEDGSEFGHGNANRRGASGWETDKIRTGAKGFHVVAVGKNSEGPAFMVCRDSEASFVFTVGSVSFTPCLDDDPVIQKLVLNLVRRGLAAGVETNLEQVEGRMNRHGAVR
jgi:hypothetical protein